MTTATGQSASVSLDVLDAVLRRGAWPDGLEAAVIELTGPYVHPEERRGIRENPAVVSAAADLRPTTGPPLVCLNGQPGAPAFLLLSRLVEGGAELRYHGDFDAGGMAIARSPTVSPGSPGVSPHPTTVTPSPNCAI